MALGGDGLCLIALASGGLAVGAPESSRWAGFVLFAGIGAVACVFLYAIWPRPGTRMADAQRLASGRRASQCCLGDHRPRRRGARLQRGLSQLAGITEGEIPPPPELALGGDPSSSVFYRLARGAAEGEPREEILTLGNGLELAAAVAHWATASRMVVHAAPHHSARTIETPKRTVAVLAPAVPSLFRDAPVGVALADEHGKVFEANHAFADFFDLPGAGTSRVTGDLIEARERQALKRSSSPKAAKQRRSRRNPSRQPARTYGRALRKPVARPAISVTSLLYLVDVSEQKALETKFAQSQKMQAVGQLAGGVAHDFNNLLTVIIGNCEFLLMRHQAGDPSFKEINEVHQNALRAAQLVGQLLAFSRKQTLQPRVLALRDVVANCATCCAGCCAKAWTSSSKISADLWPVNADEAQLSNAIINLVVNARDAMPKGGTVTIATANETTSNPQRWAPRSCRRANMSASKCADTGTGIATNIWQNLRSVLHDKARRTGHRAGPRDGLRHRQADGRIHHRRQRSRARVRPFASIFRVITSTRTRPWRRRSGPRGARHHRPGHDPSGRRRRSRAQLRGARASDARLQRARSARRRRSAGDRAATRPRTIHLLITDVVMPNMDGPTLVRAVKPPAPEMAVMFMSGYAEEAFRRNDEKAEELHFLPKPFGLKQLAAKVKDVLSGTPPPAARVA